MGKLTAATVRSVKEPGRLSDGDGLFLVVRSAKSKSWLLRVQNNGKRQDIGLGSIKMVSLADARDKAYEIRKEIARGLDPVAERKRAKMEALPVPTFAEAADLVYAENEGTWKNAKHRAQWINTIRQYANPYIGELPVDEVSGAQVRSLLSKIWLKKPETAKRVLQRVGTVLDWAHAMEYRNQEAPLRSIRKGLPKQPSRSNHFAAMPYVDVPVFMAHIRQKDTMGAAALEFLILTAARSGEVRLATWAEIDFKARSWTISADRMKVGREHRVPLSARAIAILEDQLKFKHSMDDFIFPSRKAGRPLSDMTLSKVLRDMDYPYTVHGFRSSFRDWAAEQTDYPGEVVEKALAHSVRNSVEAAYRRTDYFDKRVGLMDSWQDFHSCYRS